jgi:tetratricopeptide (TPR) repeat protein
MIAVALFLAVSAYDEGVRLFDQGRYSEAALAFQRAVDANPSDAQAWKSLGVAYAAESQYERSEPAFARACFIKPELLDACYFHARALYSLNRFEPSLKVLRRIVSSDPKPWRVHLGIAQNLEALGNYTDSEAEYKAALTYLDGVVGYGQFLIRQGRPEEAIDVLNRAAKTTDARVPYELGRAYYQLARFEDAAKALERSASLDSKSEATHLLLSKVYFALGRRTEAEQELRKPLR